MHNYIQRGGRVFRAQYAGFTADLWRPSKTRLLYIARGDMTRCAPVASGIPYITAPLSEAASLV